MSVEATTYSRIYDEHVRLKLTTLQFAELAAPRHHGGNGNGGGARLEVDGKKEEWSFQKMDKVTRDSILEYGGKNICLMSYTRQGRKKENDGCIFSHKKVGAPDCPAPLQSWIKDTYGSYVSP